MEMSEKSKETSVKRHEKFNEIVEVISKTGIRVTKIEEATVFTEVGVFRFGSEPRETWFSPNATLPAVTASSIAMTFMMVTLSKGVSNHQFVGSCFPLNDSHTAFTFDKDEVDNLSKELFKRLYGKPSVDSEEPIEVTSK